MNIDKDERWDRYEKASEALTEAKANFRSVEHNYMLALQQLRRAEVEANTLWQAMIDAHP